MQSNNQYKFKYKNNSKSKIILLSIIIIVISLFILCVLYIKSIFGNIEKIEATPEELGANSQQNLDENVNYGDFRTKDRFINIALLGIDTTEVGSFEGETRSDSIMILSIDRKEKTLKLASIARDTYAEIEDHGMDKINHGYEVGGPTFMVKTLNQNFNLNITDFVVVNFWGLADIIDRLGGVEIEVDEEELKVINTFMNTIARGKGVEPQYINEAGVHKLDGIQAVAYSRIRYTVGGDFKRTERQREVLLKLSEKVKDIKVTDILPIIEQLSSNLMTTLSVSDMNSIAMDVIKGGYLSKVSQQLFPAMDYSWEDMTGEVYYLVTDLEKATEEIHKFLFGNYTNSIVK